MEITKADWKLFRERLAVWQENYMKQLVREYIELLQGDGKASERFWALEKRINEDKRSPGVQAELRKGDVILILIRLIWDGVITEVDLDDFSESLRDAVINMPKV